uniref:Uncharacterized protein n=1 Tax=Arundo donax TaxID=35708 RepID=A0A0A9G0F4_ARUDO
MEGESSVRERRKGERDIDFLFIFLLSVC